ncbi:hypothetical protein NUU61_004556 [Penicillium alfredii]|uniref:Nudix hydrolase domain-containing protein n=1 Tax=Penicillium alfredii TaxID=1506179 RepID=A0A9W9FLG4_9EURO|nr:uncharacterized protein NUU61_004556 [Penicillium alfredii]KAJ5102334.1 hypothetical protein NUU61_004556 [Penicillium alfredii]
MDSLIVPFEVVNVPFSNFQANLQTYLQTNLQAKQLDIKSFSASATIFCCDPCDTSNLYVLLCQRAYRDDALGKDNSWGGTWETPGGSRELGEELPDTAFRETEEETGLHVSHVSSHVYLTLFNHKNVPMARCTFHTDVHEELRPQRRWCDEQQRAIGPKDSGIKLIPGEHMDFCWATEAQIRNSLPYNAANTQSGLVILENKRDVILAIFGRLRRSQIDMVKLPVNNRR